MNMVFKRKLPIPQDVKAMYPALEKDLEIRKKNVEEVKDIIAGRSDKFLLIIGPCSSDNEEAVMDYMHRLKEVEKEVNDVIQDRKSVV